MATTDDYLSLATSEHREQPLFAAVVAALTQAFADTINLELGLPQAFDLDTAVGVQLDAIGLWIGRDRNVSVPLANVYFAWDSGDPVGWNAGSWQGPFDPDTGISALPDDAYRTLLRAKIAANQLDGSLSAAYAAWQLTFQGGGQVVLIQDHMDMSMTIGFVGPALTAIQQALLTGNYLPLKPAGVRIRHYAIPVGTGPMFGWGVENSSISGWGVGSWPTLI